MSYKTVSDIPDFLGKDVLIEAEKEGVKINDKFKLNLDSTAIYILGFAVIIKKLKDLNTCIKDET